MSRLETMLRDWLGSDDPIKAAHARARLAMPAKAEPSPRVAAAKARAARNRNRPEPWCLYGSPSPGGCLPVRCHARRGVSCGGSHSDSDHCLRCLYPE